MRIMKARRSLWFEWYRTDCRNSGQLLMETMAFPWNEKFVLATLTVQKWRLNGNCKLQLVFALIPQSARVFEFRFMPVLNFCFEERALTGISLWLQFIKVLLQIYRWFFNVINFPNDNVLCNYTFEHVFRVGFFFIFEFLSRISECDDGILLMAMNWKCCR